MLDYLNTIISDKIFGSKQKNWEKLGRASAFAYFLTAIAKVLSLEGRISPKFEIWLIIS